MSKNKSMWHHLLPVRNDRGLLSYATANKPICPGLPAAGQRCLQGTGAMFPYHCQLVHIFKCLNRSVCSSCLWLWCSVNLPRYIPQKTLQRPTHCSIWYTQLIKKHSNMRQHQSRIESKMMILGILWVHLGIIWAPSQT